MSAEKQKRKRRPLTDDQQEILKKARLLSRIIGLVSTLDANGLDQVDSYLQKRRS